MTCRTSSATTIAALIATSVLPWGIASCIAQQEAETQSDAGEAATSPAYDIQWAPVLQYLRSYSNPSTAPQLPTDNVPLRANTIIVYEFDLPHDLREGPHMADSASALQALRDHVRASVERLIPDPAYSGYGVIDWESWYPLWVEPQHRPTTYPTIWPRWIDHMRTQRPTELAGLRGTSLEAKYRESYDAASQAIFLAMLETAKETRPGVKWGYYSFPNPVMSGYTTTNNGNNFWMDRNDRLAWLYNAQTAIFPCLYIQKKSFPESVRLTRPTQARESANLSFIQTNMTEARRIAGDKPILPFVWMRYHDSNPDYGLQPLNDFDLQVSFERPKELGATGIIVWESVQDVPTFNLVRNYMNLKFNPLARRIGDPSAWTSTLLPPQDAPPASPTPAPAMLRATRVDAGAASTGNSSGAAATSGNAATRSYRRELRAERQSSAGNPTAAEARAALRRANRP
ncbi:MAG: hypothetical protein AB7Q00_02605 [Phycisphaerales bacterium]